MITPIGVLYHDKICPMCGLRKTKDGHDPCIPNLPGVKFACCGHGIRSGYIYFENGCIIDFIPIEVRGKVKFPIK